MACYYWPKPIPIWWCWWRRHWLQFTNAVIRNFSYLFGRFKCVNINTKWLNSGLHRTRSIPMRRITVEPSVYRRLINDFQSSIPTNIESSLSSDDAISSVILSPDNQDKVYASYRYPIFANFMHWLITRFYQERKQEEDTTVVEDMETTSSPSPPPSPRDGENSPKVIVDSITAWIPSYTRWFHANLRDTRRCTEFMRQCCLVQWQAL